MPLLCFSILVIASFALADTSELDWKQQARGILLKKGRSQSLKYLGNLRIEYSDNLEKLKLIEKEAVKIGKMFLTEKAQMSFELAESAFYSSQDNARSLYELALVAEDTNFQIYSGLIRESLRNGDCPRASELSNRTQQLWPHWVELKWLNVLLKRCQGKLNQSEALRSFDQDSRYSFMAKSLRLALLVDAGKKKEARVLAKSLFEKDPKFPETYYYFWKLNEKDSEWSEHSEKYVNLCGSALNVVRRKYMLDPLVCSRQAEVTSSQVKK